MGKVTASMEKKASYRKLYEQIHRTYEGRTAGNNEDPSSLSDRLKAFLYHLRRH